MIAGSLIETFIEYRLDWLQKLSVQHVYSYVNWRKIFTMLQLYVFKMFAFLYLA